MPARPRLGAPSPGGSRATTPPPAANPDAGDTIYEAGGALQGLDAEARRPTPPGHHCSTSDCIAGALAVSSSPRYDGAHGHGGACSASGRGSALDARLASEPDLASGRSSGAASRPSLQSLVEGAEGGGSPCVRDVELAQALSTPSDRLEPLAAAGGGHRLRPHSAVPSTWSSSTLSEGDAGSCSNPSPSDANTVRLRPPQGEASPGGDRATGRLAQLRLPPSVHGSTAPAAAAPAAAAPAAAAAQSSSRGSAEQRREASELLATTREPPLHGRM